VSRNCSLSTSTSSVWHLSNHSLTKNDSFIPSGHEVFLYPPPQTVIEETVKKPLRRTSSTPPLGRGGKIQFSVSSLKSFRLIILPLLRGS
jgi:hypothetical protein